MKKNIFVGCETISMSRETILAGHGTVLVGHGTLHKKSRLVPGGISRL